MLEQRLGGGGAADPLEEAVGGDATPELDDADDADDDDAPTFYIAKTETLEWRLRWVT